MFESKIKKEHLPQITEMRKQGLTFKEIAGKLNEQYNLDIKDSTIIARLKYEAKKLNPKKPKKSKKKKPDMPVEIKDPDTMELASEITEAPSSPEITEAEIPQLPIIEEEEKQSDQPDLTSSDDVKQSEELLSSILPQVEPVKKKEIIVKETELMDKLHGKEHSNQDQDKQPKIKILDIIIILIVAAIIIYGIYTFVFKKKKPKVDEPREKVIEEPQQKKIMRY